MKQSSVLVTVEDAHTWYTHSHDAWAHTRDYGNKAQYKTYRLMGSLITAASFRWRDRSQQRVLSHTNDKASWSGDDGPLNSVTGTKCIWNLLSSKVPKIRSHRGHFASRSPCVLWIKHTYVLEFHISQEQIVNIGAIKIQAFLRNCSLITTVSWELFAKQLLRDSSQSLVVRSANNISIL